MSSPCDGDGRIDGRVTGARRWVTDPGDLGRNPLTCRASPSDLLGCDRVVSATLCADVSRGTSD